MKEVHLSEEAMHLKLFNKMLKEIKQFTEKFLYFFFSYHLYFSRHIIMEKRNIAIKLY